MKQLTISILAVVMLLLVASGAEAQTKDKTYFVPFTLKQLQELNKQAQKADSAAINGHNVMLGFNLLRALMQAFNESYQTEEAADRAKADSLSKANKPKKSTTDKNVTN